MFQVLKFLKKNNIQIYLILKEYCFLYFYSIPISLPILVISFRHSKDNLISF